MWTQILTLLTAFQTLNLIVPIDGDQNSCDLTTQNRWAVRDIVIGDCRIVTDRTCPDSDVQFFLYTQKNPEDPEHVQTGPQNNCSNLSKTSFDPRKPSKIIIHGYSTDMNLNVLVNIRREYLKTNDFNIFVVDWSPLAQGPCYPAAVWNTKHTGDCIAQLVQRIRELGNEDIHIVGFSLGAQVPNYVARALQPYKVKRITGLDPAGPGFTTVGTEYRLDQSDAEFVDVIHTNALMQGTVVTSGHVDFYVNGGTFQPGCWAETRFFACNHHRAPIYFGESINTETGFFGWPCSSYVDYLLGRCPPKEPQIIMGEHIDQKSASGVHLVITSSAAPFAIGKFTGPAIEIYYKSERNRIDILKRYKTEIKNFIDEDDVIESLEEHNRYKKIMDYYRSYLEDNRKIVDLV